MALTSLSVGRGWALPLLFLACAASAFRQDRGLSPDNATEWTTDYASAAISDSPEYDRCKTTHRCNRAFAEYDVDIGRYLFRQERFSGGRQENADLFLAFEDWKAGTVGLGVDHSYLLGQVETTQGAHFNSFDPAWTIPDAEVNSTFQWSLDYNSSDIYITFNTTEDPPLLTIFNSSCNEAVDTCEESFQGYTATTSGNTQTSLFNFHSIYVGPGVNITVVGERALVLISRSTAIYDTPIRIEPGTVGAFPKLRGPSPYNNNFWGVGSGATRVYTQTLTTYGQPILEIQTVTTSAVQGQQLGGGFKLSYMGVQSHMIAHNVLPSEMKRALQSVWDLAGFVDVSRTRPDNQGGYTWSITFSTAIGNPPQIAVEDHLTGIGHNVTSATFQDGNVLTGTYTIAFFGGVTRQIPVTASEGELETILNEDLASVGLVSAHVTRTDPTGQCQAGLCYNGPQQAWGYTYFLTLATYDSVNVPTSPTRPGNPRYNQPGLSFPAVIYSENVTCTTPHTTAAVQLSPILSNSLATRMPYFPYGANSPQTIPFGGAGGSNGGQGGVGHSTNPPYPNVQGDAVTRVDLVAGSNGASGGEIVEQTYNLSWNCGAGGSGGAALELIAVNDLIIGAHGGINLDGEEGENGFRAGGGGSGGTLLISAGGVIVIHSTISARGGAGGKGVGLGGRGGGGGGGGRVAAYAQSINIVGGSFNLSGGVGGADQPRAPPPPTPYIGQLGVYYPYKSFFDGVLRNSSNFNGKEGWLNLVSAGGSQYIVDLAGGAENTQRCLRLTINETVVTDTGVMLSTPFANNGPAFSIPASGSGDWLLRRGVAQIPQSAGGIGDDGSRNPGTNPRRVTVYVKIEPPPYGTVVGHWGAHIALHEFDYRPLVNTTNGQPGTLPEGNVQGGTGGAGSGGPGSSTAFGGVAGDGGKGGGYGNDAAGMIGVAIVNGVFKHEANYRHTPGLDLQPNSPAAVVYKNVESGIWYKIDIFIDWDHSTYKVRINDTTVVLNQTFSGNVVRRIGLYGFDAGTVWFDEVYAGPDNQMRFECPATIGDADLSMTRPLQYNWNMTDVGSPSSYHDITTWQNHLSVLKKFERPEAVGIDLADSYQHRAFFEDVITKTADAVVPGTVRAGVLIYLPYDRVDECGGVPFGDSPSDEMRHRAETTINANGEWSSGADSGPAPSNYGVSGRYVWYGDHSIDTSLEENSNYALDRAGASYIPALPAKQGGLYACSTTDFVTWRNEGIMIYFVNITRPALDPLDYITRAKEFYLLAQRPKVIYNELYQQYVMWTYTDNYNLDLRMAGVMQSCWYNGPFTFTNVQEPDGNETTDLTVFVSTAGSGFLARTYYTNKTYYLPEPIMQPVWSSVPTANSDPVSPTVDYGLNYHRAYYHNGYDNIEDIYTQRWRKEDVAWRIQTGHIVETFDGITGRFVLTDTLTQQVIASAAPARRQVMLATYLDNSTFRDIIGQGQPPILTRYKDPNLNSWWAPSSVPAVKAQPWVFNYHDKNIADNPIQETVADLLIGPAHVVEVRRTKYVSLSLLTNDFLNSRGVMRVMEGELEHEDDLVVLIGELANEYDTLGWNFQLQTLYFPSFTSTYPADTDGANKGVINFQQEFDWQTRFWQYYNTFSDRRYDFVNFRDKQTSLACPALHNATVLKDAECTAIWNAIVFDLSPTVINWEKISYSHFETKSTVAYEACLADHVKMLQQYEACVQAAIPDYDGLPPWGVGFRECIGGGGVCGPPANGQVPVPTPPLVPRRL